MEHRLLIISFLTLLALASLHTPSLALADHTDYSGGYTGETFPPPWASQPKDARNPNANAGYLGSHLPPSEYNPDAPRYGQPEKTAPMPSLVPGALQFDPQRGLCGGNSGRTCDGK